MSQTREIVSRESLNEFIDEVDYLHDSVIHEATIQNTCFVDDRGWMHGDTDLPDAKLLIQSQSADVIAVEVTLRRVSAFSLRFDLAPRLEGELSGEKIVLYPNGRANAASSKIEAEEISYRLLPSEYRGKQFVLASDASIE